MTFVTPAQAARDLGVSPETVRCLCRTGRLGRRVLGRYRIGADEVRELLAGARPSPKRESPPYALDRHPATP